MKRIIRVLRVWWVRRLRSELWGPLRSWYRHQIGRIVAGVLMIWVVGAVALHLAEQDANADFATWTESFWNVWVLLFSGLDNPPKTIPGRMVTMVLLVLGVGLAGLFTAGVASILIERYLRRNTLQTFDMENHLVLCNWSPRGLDWIREVHSKFVQEKRPVVVIHDNTEEVDLPDKADDPAFNDVYIVKGDCTNEVILRRARVPRAHSVVVLTDTREGKHADGKSILTCIAIRHICRGEKQPNIASECLVPGNRHHLKQAGADEIISSNDLGLRLLARTALFHGMTRVYQELLSVGRDANEMYLLPAPAELVGKDFIEIAGMFLRYRGDKRSCLLLGFQRGDEMMLNPIGGEAGPLRADDELIILSRVYLDPDLPMPTNPPVAHAPSS